MREINESDRVTNSANLEACLFRLVKSSAGASVTTSAAPKKSVITSA